MYVYPEVKSFSQSYSFYTVPAESSLKRVTTTQAKLSLQLGAFPERPGDTEMSLTRCKYFVPVFIHMVCDRLQTTVNYITLSLFSFL